MSEIERINKDIARIKREIRFQKNYMEKPGRDLVPNPKPEYLARLVQGRERLAIAKEALKKAGGEYKPDAEDIRAEELLDNLPFMKKLSFEFGGYFGGYRTYTVEAIDSSLPGGMFKYCIDDEKVGKKLPDPSLIQNPTKTPLVIKNLEDLADYLKEIHLEEWMPEYWPDRFGVAVCDGTQWHLKIKFSNGQPLWESFGSNSYPYNFDDFQKLFGLSFDDEEE